MRKTQILASVSLAVVLITATMLVLDSSDKQAQAAQPVSFGMETVVSGFHRPLYVTHAGDGSGRLFVAEQSGKIKIVENGVVLPDPFLDASGWISRAALENSYTERGLLGLAFDPDYATTGEFYINYTDQSGHSVIARLKVSDDDPNRADPVSAVQILYLNQPYANHNGGHMAFGPDGYLYVSFGDGGSGGDPDGNGQNLSTLLGTILRLDVRGQSLYAIPEDNPFVDNPNARPEIWAWGVRNVWRFSFDRATGDLYMGDVGQNQWEEINVQLAGSPGGENYGWNAYEADHVFSGRAPASDVIYPVLEYDHSRGWCSVTGGYVYRGATIPALQGTYFYGDYCTGTIWTAEADESGTWQSAIAYEAGRQISSFGEDEDGELYVVDYGGAVLRVVPAE